MIGHLMIYNGIQGGDHTNMENYKPISLLSHLYELFFRIINIRLTKKLNSYHSVEQTGFRNGFGTNKYNTPLHLAFVGYQKTFDSIGTWSFLTTMESIPDILSLLRIFTIGQHSTLK